jgi:NADPH2:quinone reductase
MDTFRAYRIDEQDGKIVAGFQQLSVDDLTEGNVVVRVSHSTINYKDALAATGAGKILRRHPLNGGIDLAGVVVSSEDPDFQPGTAVLVNGCGLSETVDGGYSEYARLDSQSLVPIPEGLDAHQAMQLGTAGYTAALAIHRMEQNGQLPENGPVVVTGATGGVGSIAIDMLAGRGYEVVALTGKASGEAYLKSLGASSILLRDELDLGKRPMERAQWAGAIDNLGGDYLTCSAVHSQGGLPARHQLGRHAERPAAGRLVEDRRQPQAATPGRDRRAHYRVRRPARQFPGVSRR